MSQTIPFPAASKNYTGKPRKPNPNVKLPRLQVVKAQQQMGVDDSSRNVFSTVPLEADSGGRPSYMPYDKLHFPQITRDIGANGAAEAHALWMVGMLHHEDDHGPSGRDVQKVRQYEVRLTALHRQTATKASQYAQKMFNIVSGIKRSGEQGGHPKAQILSKKEQERIKELEGYFRKGLMEGADAIEASRKRKDGLDGKPTEMPGSLKERIRANPLAAENKKLRTSLGLRGRKGAKLRKQHGANRQTNVQASGVADLEVLERIHQRCAIKIQRAVRRHLRIAYWNKFILATKSASAIQRTWKGYRIRCWFLRYIRERDRASSMLQALARGRQARILLRDMMDERHSKATEIQRFVRAQLVMKRVHVRLRHRRAAQIQALWRGVTGRAKADRAYLDKHAILIQKQVRCFMERLTFQRMHREQTAAARVIQTSFRSYTARCIRNQRLWERGADMRAELRELLHGQDAYLKRMIETINRRKVRANYDVKIAQLELEFETEVDTILLNEFDYVNSQNEHARLSPRGLQQGWAKQLLNDLERYRSQVTKHKEHSLFVVAKQQRKLVHDKNKTEHQLQALIEERKYLNERWIAERQEAIERENQLEWGSRQLNLAKDAAQEKRKWKVRYFTDTGKPDLKREKPKELWTADDFPFRQSKQFNVTHADITALTRDSKKPDTEVAKKQRTEYLKLRHFLTMYGPHGAVGVGEASGYAPDMLPHPMTHEQVEDAVLTGSMPMGLQAGEGIEGAGMVDMDGRVPTRAGKAILASSMSMFPELERAHGVPPHVAAMPPPPGAAAAPASIPAVGPGLPSANFAQVSDDLTWNGGIDGAGAVLGAGFVGDDGQWYDAADIATMQQQAPPADITGPARLGRYGQPLGAPGVHPAQYAMDAGAPSAMASPRSRPGTGLTSHPGSRPASSNAGHLPRLPYNKVGGKPGTPGFHHNLLQAERAAQGRPSTSASAAPLRVHDGVDEDVVRGLSQSTVHRPQSRTSNMSLATYVTREVAEQQEAKRREHLAKLGLDPATSDQHVDETGALKPATVRRSVPVQVAMAQHRANEPRRFGGTGEAADADGTEHRQVSKLKEVMQRTHGSSKHPQEDDVNIVGGFDARGRAVMPDYLISIMGNSSHQDLSTFNPGVAKQQQQVDAAYKDRELKAKMPPGLQAARNAEAAYTLAKARAEGRIGRTSVSSTAADRKAAAEEEQKRFDQVGDRVNSLVEKLGALSGQMETIQYGAMLKPAFGVMAKVMNKIGAGPKGAFDPAGDLKDRQRLEQRSALLGSEYAAEVDTVHQAYGPSGGLGETDVVEFTDEQGSHFAQPKPKPLSPRSQIRARRVRASDMLDNLW